MTWKEERKERMKERRGKNEEERKERKLDRIVHRISWKVGETSFVGYVASSHVQNHAGVTVR